MKVINIAVLVLALSMITYNSSGQTFIVAGQNNEVLIKGTSNLHDWQMVVSESNCDANFNIEGGQLISINKVDFNCKASDIKSDHDLMDKKTFSALKADKFPEIRFSFEKGIELASGSGEYRGLLLGKLYISGVSRVVKVPFSVTLNPNNTIHVSGTIELNMSDFDVTPPTALLGTLKTGDKVSVEYSLNLMSKTQLSYR
jgi:polyisoprenoid-binding protein YceI